MAIEKTLEIEFEQHITSGNSNKDPKSFVSMDPSSLEGQIPYRAL